MIAQLVQETLVDANIAREIQCNTTMLGYESMQELLAEHLLLDGAYSEQPCLTKLDSFDAPGIWNHGIAANAGMEVSSDMILSCEFSEGIDTNSTQRRSVLEMSHDPGVGIPHGIPSQNRHSHSESNISQLHSATENSFLAGNQAPRLYDSQSTSSEEVVRDRKYKYKTKLQNSSFELSEPHYDGTKRLSKHVNGFPGSHMPDVHTTPLGTTSKSIASPEIHALELRSAGERLQRVEKSISASRRQRSGNSSSPSTTDDTYQLCLGSYDNFKHASEGKWCTSPSSTVIVNAKRKISEIKDKKHRRFESQLLLDMILDRKHFESQLEHSIQSNIIAKNDQRIRSKIPESLVIKHRSLKEKRRRDRISNELNKLRAAVPSPLVRGTDTAGMLNGATEYIILLEKRVLELEDNLFFRDSAR
eukprot:TRINITY_DN563_c0_g1_i3.p1 TRINITY_DN563_c0_g1~~TRINITY_DN563_c0_g1_i3.p1  ORF type:complete len:418 (+),score=26.41 TRINITY_DN563_c0_g1_i3:76-1329(+)